VAEVYVIMAGNEQLH